MTEYRIPDKKDYQPFVDCYKKEMKVGKDAELFLGTDPLYRIQQRGSYVVGSTDIINLIDYCLFPIYLEGNTSIAQRTFDILKELSSNADLLKLDKVTDYLLYQYRTLSKYDNVPFLIDTKKLVSLIIDSIEKLTKEQKEEFLYSGICKILDIIPDFREIDKERVNRIVDEYKQWKQLHPKKTIKREDYHPVKLDTEVIDGAEVEDSESITIKLLKESKASTDELINYLKRFDTKAADKFKKDGKWPSKYQIPKDSSVLTFEGRIDWNQTPENGFV